MKSENLKVILYGTGCLIGLVLLASCMAQISIVALGLMFVLMPLSIAWKILEHGGEKSGYLFIVLIVVFWMYGKRYINAYDGNFIPFGIKAFDVWVYNDNTDQEYYAGSIETDYLNASDRLSDAQLLAYEFAENKYLKRWSYICCTVTESSSCVTKVR